ncbi:TRAP transporter small permease [uncultured Oscillibacter sp.]|uniref:TRAP transporter small permease n=1 Tax=uncultured Oscillibacter sp. TaxID=876091 RepID=UPI0025FC9DBD|nr:TRAP transporter small permease [uncultured Oscillibacter sp.]
MKKSWFDNILEVVGGIAFLLIVLSTFTEVISRYVFNHSFNWAQEVPTYLMIVLGMIGATEAMKTDSHIRITLFLDKLPPRVRDLALQLIDIACVVFCVVVADASVGVVAAQSLRTSTGAHINMGLVYAVLPVFLLIMAGLAVLRVVRRFREISHPSAGRDKREEG